jgi:hypothetical protein
MKDIYVPQLFFRTDFASPSHRSRFSEVGLRAKILDSRISADLIAFDAIGLLRFRLLGFSIPSQIVHEGGGRLACG